MGKHRGDIGGALLVSTVACWIGAITVAALKGSPLWAVIVLSAGGALCLVLSLWAFGGWGDIAGSVRRAAGWLRSVPSRLAKWIPFVLWSPIVWRGLPSSTRRSGAPGVVRAIWGAGHGKEADVTETVKALVREERLPFIANNETLVGSVDKDPAKYEVKKLEIKYRLSGLRWATVTFDFDEGASVNLPVPGLRADDLADPRR